MRSVLLVFASYCLGCGSVSVKSDAGNKDGTTSDTSGDGTSSTCGAAGQACCATTTNKCAMNLTCTAGDQICRSAEVFFVAADSNLTTGNAMVGRGDGSNFTVQTIGTGAPTAIYGTSSTDVWVTVQGPTTAQNVQTSWARHWNGASWGPITNFPDGFIVYALWGNAPNNYWAANNGGGVLHYDGTSWSAPVSTGSSQVLIQAWGAGSDLYVAGNTLVHGDASQTWAPVTLTGWGGFSQRAISGHANGDFISGGYDNSQTPNPAVLRHSGSAYTVEPVGNGSDCSTTLGVWDGPDDEWALTSATIAIGNCVAQPKIVHYSGGTWTPMGFIPDSKLGTSLWGTSSKDLFAIGQNAAGTAAVFHYDGTIWTTAYTNTSAAYMRAIWGIGGLP